jgi:hypothetical protein
MQRQVHSRRTDDARSAINYNAYFVAASFRPQRLRMKHFVARRE